MMGFGAMAALFLVALVIAILVNQAVYDGDLRCLVAECRIVKK